jgi:hypothetical protein
MLHRRSRKMMIELKIYVLCVYKSKSEFADSGNLTFNVEYDGINVTAMPQANVSECYNLCKSSQGTHLKQTATYVHDFADE